MLDALLAYPLENPHGGTLDAFLAYPLENPHAGTRMRGHSDHLPHKTPAFYPRHIPSIPAARQNADCV